MFITSAYTVWQQREYDAVRAVEHRARVEELDDVLGATEEAEEDKDQR